MEEKAPASIIPPLKHIREQPVSSIPLVVPAIHNGHMVDLGVSPVAPAKSWIQVPISTAVPINCSPGLEYLAKVDGLLVKEKVELLEVFTGFVGNKKYFIKNSLGQRVYYVAEDTDYCTRHLCGPLRPFDMRVFDNLKREVMHFSRPLASGSCCFPCCLQEIEITAPPGTPIGYVRQEWSFAIPKFLVQNGNHETVLRIDGPSCIMSCMNEVEFQILTADRTKQVGKITRQWLNVLKEVYTDEDNFGIRFPIDLDVTVKATLLAALFLIDFIFFERHKHCMVYDCGLLLWCCNPFC